MGRLGYTEDQSATRDWVICLEHWGASFWQKSPKKTKNLLAYLQELAKEREFLTKDLDLGIQQAKAQIESAKEDMARIFPDGQPKNYLVVN
jgi:hypothetical protein